MCGVAGIHDARRQVDRELLLSMAGELLHRGPDGVGLYLSDGFGMAAARLAVVDLERGDQPLATTDRRYWAMQNGEIYNHHELRRELEGLGHRFETHCDTEVIAHAYQEWGPACLTRLNGDFALAVWDERKRELFLARDRFGVRPLFLLEHGPLLAFASEAKALLRHPAARRELDPLALVETFTAWSVSPSRSAFAGIRELAPAHYLLVRDDGSREERRWWDLEFKAAEPVPSLDEAAEELQALLDDAIGLRLRADVPVAAYLSGGLDSSTIVALARRHVTAPVALFGLGFAQQEYDESSHQSRLAEAFGLDLVRVEVSGEDVAELLPRAVALAEKPMLRTAPVPLLALSGGVRAAGIKVVLTGEGADELFAGYDVFRENKIRHFWARDPESTWRPRLIERMYPYLPRQLAPSRLLRQFFAQGLEETADPLYSHLGRFANTGRCLRLVRPDVARAGTAPIIEELRERVTDRITPFTPLGRAQYIEIATFLTGFLLHAQGDRMLMGNSVEGRFPFLDYRVAELAARLPDSYRLLGLHEKVVLRKAVVGLLPDEIRCRPKQPYRAPIASALSGPAAARYLDDLLSPERIERAGLFDPAAVTRLRAKATAERSYPLTETEEMGLVGVASTMLLHQAFVDAPISPTRAEPSKIVVGGEPSALEASASE